MKVSPKDVHFVLEIELDTPPTSMGGQAIRLLNLVADPKAILKDIKVGDIGRYCAQIEDFIYYTDDELNTLIIYDKENIQFQCLNGIKKYYNFPNKKATIKEFVDAIIDFEKISRPAGDWFGGIDCHHIFYEGIFPIEENDTYMIHWGS